MHRAIAEKLSRRPELIGIAHENLGRWYETAGRARPYLDAWREILALPLQELICCIQRDDERMTALRQSSPFAGILEPRERWAIYAEFEAPRGETVR